MRRILAFLSVFCLLLSLISCGEPKKAPEPVKQVSAQTMNDTLGYAVLTFTPETLNQTQISYVSSALQEETIGIVSYSKEKSDIELRMTLEQARLEGLAGFENAAQAGGIDAPSAVFSPLVINVLDKSTYYCEFSYTYESYPCYLSLSATNTSFSDYSELLITYANQLYAMTQAPDFTVVIEKQRQAEREEKRKREAEEKGEVYVPANQEAAEQNTAPESPTDTTDTMDTASQEQTQDTADQSADASSTTTDTAPPQETAQPLTLDYDDITLVHIGDGYTLSPSGGDGTYTWQSADNSVATVSEDGSVFAVGAGETNVTCTSGDGLTAVCVVRVTGKSL